MNNVTILNRLCLFFSVQFFEEGIIDNNVAESQFKSFNTIAATVYEQ
jgi:hypothetical protein